MQGYREFGEDGLRAIVEQCLRRALPEGAPLPPEDQDWIDSGALDSMDLVDVFLCIEKATALTDVLGRIEGKPPSSTQEVMTILRRAARRDEQVPQSSVRAAVGSARTRPAIAGWGAALGSVRIEAAALEREYALASGTLREGAGIESVTRASATEDEATLGCSAARAALKTAGVDAGELDWIVSSSETFLGYPSLAACLHSRLLLRDACGALDVGGACVGLLNSLSVAKALLAAGMANRVLVATADVHSRPLAAGRVPGEFGGLFGDGASAFVLGCAGGPDDAPAYRLGDFQFGCAGAFSSALAVGPGADGQIALKFEGEALARAAVGRLERIIADLELRSGFSRDEVSCFATHQPNPRLVELLARQADLPPEKFPLVAKTCGNLGTSTCGVALAKALDTHGKKSAEARGPIFLAAVGPGMLWGGGVLF